MECQQGCWWSVVQETIKGIDWHSTADADCWLRCWWSVNWVSTRVLMDCCPRINQGYWLTLNCRCRLSIELLMECQLSVNQDVECSVVQESIKGIEWHSTADADCQLSCWWGPVRGGLYVPRLNFKPSHVAISEGSHVAVGILSSGLSFVVISAPSCRRLRAVSSVGIYPNRASLMECQLSVNQGVECSVVQESIKDIDQHWTTDTFSTHDPT